MTNDKQHQISLVFSAIRDLIPADYLQTCSEWAEKNRYLNKKVSSRPGYFSYRNSPYTREIADCLSKTSPVREAAVMKGVQLGFTTGVIENGIGYKFANNPGPSMFVLPTDKTCEEYKKLKLDNLIDSSGLRKNVTAETENRNTRRTGDTAFLIEFTGGFLKLASAQKGHALRTTPIETLFLDEVDGYPDEIKNEGSPIDIAVKRTDAYYNVRKIIYGSTPTKKHNSKINELYEKGDKRKYYVPCPFCGEFQELVFYRSDGGEYDDEKAVFKDKIKTKPFGLLFNIDECREGDYSSVVYRCKYCGCDIKEHQKQEMLIKGEWRATAQSKKPNFRSYHISALYSLTKDWKAIVFDFIDAGKDAKKLQTFFNLNLGLPFEDRMGGLEYQQVHRLKDDLMPDNLVPADSLFLTAAADIQRDRIEVEIKAWGDRFRCHGISHRVFYGNTSDVYDNCWQNLAKIKDEIFTTKNNKKMRIELMLVDSGDGELTDVVYSFCDLFGDYLIFPSKGLPTTTRTKDKFKIVDLQGYDSLSLVEIHVDFYKNTLARCLVQEWRSDDIYPDYWFSFSQGYSDEYFRQLTTERKEKIKLPSGLISIKWVQHGRNEAFDLNVYNLAAADIVIYQYSVTALKLEASNPREVFNLFRNQ